jgi:hypothetical protein
MKNNNFNVKIHKKNCPISLVHFKYRLPFENKKLIVVYLLKKGDKNKNFIQFEKSMKQKILKKKIEKVYT